MNNFAAKSTKRGKNLWIVYLAFHRQQISIPIGRTPSIETKRKGSSNGDPFLIATAILEDGIIVTDEGNKNNGIPMVCESLGVEYMKLNDMLDEVLE